MRNLATGQCLAVDGQATAGAAVRLTACSSAESERWSYEFDGLLRSGADPSLCLAADPRPRNVRLSLCDAHTGEVTYILTGHGELLLRPHQGLALAANPDDKPTEVVVADHDASSSQRWALETAQTEAAPKSRT
ncbi:RICIN domain-containing protein [Streptomyces sp. T21Q-yed]|uniref:RICIN domain-containing protein n=1 Tax=Streptomyces sp. T21Q-yed TaxID=3018441 RepID=UPI00236733D7|nr:RICIN domain-containing protein [Streptomyces sp. T21Q-yed]MDF3143223.1 RICIN domain-containing protein [Streptomyces sp. T21Q-yed]WDF44922.1 RICIN domain-containing protein [Streptomyces sp. T12]